VRVPVVEGDWVTEFEVALEREIAGLQTGDYGAVERRRSAKRLDWLAARGYLPRSGDPNPAAPASPRQALELLFFGYMGLTPHDIVVAEESWVAIYFETPSDSAGCFNFSTKHSRLIKSPLEKFGEPYSPCKIRLVMT